MNGFATALAALALMFACATPQPKKLETDKLETSAVTNGFGVTIADLSNATLERAVRAGFKIIRVDLQWAEVERVKDRYDWSTYDPFVQNLTRRGLRPMFILDFNNPLYNPRKDSMDAIDTPQEMTGFKNFAVAAVRRYQRTNPIWELYNEPNRPQFWNPPNAQDYVTLAKATIPAMRQASPGIYIVGPALGHNPTISLDGNPESTDKLDYAYLEKTFKAGLLEHIDAISIHPYPDGPPEQAVGIYAKTRALIAKYAPTKKPPVISGEWGYTSAAAYSSDPQIHANYWTRMFLLNASQKIPVSIGYKLEYSTLDPNLDDYELGFPLFDADGKAKLAFTQIQTMIASLKGLSFIRRVNSANNDYLLKFSNGKRTLTAAWTTGKAHSVTVYGRSRSLTGKPIFILK